MFGFLYSEVWLCCICELLELLLFVCNAVDVYLLLVGCVVCFRVLVQVLCYVLVLVFGKAGKVDTICISRLRDLGPTAK